VTAVSPARIGDSPTELESYLIGLSEAESGEDFIVAASSNYRLSRIIATNCGEWALETLDSICDTSKAKSLLSEMTDRNPYWLPSDNGVKHRYDPVVYAAAYGFSKVPIRVDRTVSMVWNELIETTDIVFHPDSVLWSEADRLRKRWESDNEGLSNKKWLSDFDSCFNVYAEREQSLVDFIRGKFGRPKHPGTLSLEMVWDICKNKFRILT
jgi:hypothetical protein